MKIQKSNKDGRPYKNAQNVYAVLKNQSIAIQDVLMRSSIGVDIETYRALLTQIKDNVDNVILPGLLLLVSRRRRTQRVIREMSDKKQLVKTKKTKKGGTK